MRVELPDDDRAGRPQPRDDDRVARSATLSASTFEAAVVRVPATSITSLTPTGTPWSGPPGGPSASASARASSPRTVMNAL